MGKIGDLFKTKELVDDIVSRTEENTKAVVAMKTEVESFTKGLDGLKQVKEQQDRLLKEFNSNLREIQEAQVDFKKEIYDFRLMKSTAQKQILKKFEEELSNEIIGLSDKLKLDAGNYEKVKEQMAEIVSRISTLSSEIDKLTSISKNLKKEDFELTKFAKDFMALDQEKLELMRKIDTLERLVSKMRRH